MHDFWEKLGKASYSLGAFIVIAAITLAIWLGSAVQGIKIESSFKKLLPERSPSVVTLEKIESRVKSTATLHVVVGGQADWPSMRRFIDDFVAGVPDSLGDMIDRVEYNGNEVGAYFEKNKYLYIDHEDLQIIYDRLKRQIEYEKISQSPLFIELDEAPQFDISDIEAKYTQATTQYENYRDGYFTNADATLAMVVLKPKFGATDVGTARKLIDRAQALVDQLDPKSYHPEMRVGFGGKYPKVITEFETILGDMVRTLTLCAILVGLIVLLYFRRLRMGALMICAAGLGALGALAIARYTIGYLTAQTAFLGSIIVGNGINYSLIMMARYVEERRDHMRDPLPSVITALRQTWKPTLASALTTAAAFAVLALAHIRGFSQFGYLGGLGMLFCWLITYLMLPGWLLTTERIWPLKYTTRSRRPFAFIVVPLSKWITHHRDAILRATVGIGAVALLITGFYLPNSLEYDFGNLRFQVEKNELTHGDHFDFDAFVGTEEELQDTWQRWAQQRTDHILGGSGSPVVIMADREDQVAAICTEVERKAENLYTRQGNRIFGECRSLQSYIPSDQPEKLKLLKKLRGLLDKSVLAFLSESQLALVDEFKQTRKLRPVDRKDVPETLVDIFREADGREGLVVYVYPTPKANLWHGVELKKFSNLVRATTLPSGEVIHSSGNPVIFSDLLQVITRDGPIISFFSFLAVLCLVWLNFRERHAVQTVIGCLSLGILGMIALLPIFGVKLNFLNFVAFPIAFGIGVDYAVNIHERYIQDGAGSMEHVVRNVGGAIFLCSLTTLAGYAVLMISRNGALRSFGLAGLLAEIACLSAALIVLPAYLLWKEKLRELKE